MRVTERTGMADERRFLCDEMLAGIRTRGTDVHVCPRCGRLYWEGGHVRRIRRRLAGFAEPVDTTRP